MKLSRAEISHTFTMFCCVRTRRRKEGNCVDRSSPPPGLRAAAPQPPAYSFDGKEGKSVTGGGIRDGNMVVLAGAGVATAAAGAVIMNNGSGGGACGVAGVGEPSGGGETNQGCFGSGGSCGCGGWCGSCGCGGYGG